MAQEEEGVDSVYDFLYNDSRRIGSFLSQFNKYGHLTNVISGRSATNQDGPISSGVGLGLAGIASFDESSADGSFDSATRQSEEQYDPLWINSLTLLDYLDGKNLLKRDVREARIGEFVLFSGALLIIDTKFVKDLYSSDGGKMLLSEHLKSQGIDPESSRGKSEFDFYEKSPEFTHARLRNDDLGIWSLLDRGSMIIPPMEVALKHGVEISGTWSIVGIKDADAEEDIRDLDELTSWREQKNLEIAGECGFQRYLSDAAIVSMGTYVNLGKPRRYHGVSPLMVFREIGGD